MTGQRGRNSVSELHPSWRSVNFSGSRQHRFHPSHSSAFYYKTNELFRFILYFIYVFSIWMTRQEQSGHGGSITDTNTPFLSCCFQKTLPTANSVTSWDPASDSRSRLQSLQTWWFFCYFKVVLIPCLQVVLGFCKYSVRPEQLASTHLYRNPLPAQKITPKKKKTSPENMINCFSPVCRTGSVCKSLSVWKSNLETQKNHSSFKNVSYLKRQNRMSRSSF